MNDAFLAAKSLADELEQQWQQTFARFSAGMIVKDAPDPRLHFEVRVRNGAIVVLCRTAQANGWHRIRKLARKPWDKIPVSVVFEPLKLKDGNYHVPEPTEHPCEKCGDPTLNEKLCRDCGIDEAIDAGRCEECGLFIYADWCKIERSGHAETCSKGVAVAKGAADG